MKMKDEVSDLKNKGLVPHLTVILVGDNPASKSYVNGKKKAAAETSTSADVIEIEVTITVEKLSDAIDELNQQPSVHGILVQLLQPDHIREQNIIEAIDPTQDVEG